MNLENVGFDCTGQEFIEEDVNWTCKSSSDSYDYMVEVYGSSASSIRVVEAVALDFSGKGVADTGLDFLAYIATLPYKDAQPEQARDWVRENYSTHNATATFGSATFTIFTTVATSVILRIEGLPE
jgi:hypothetical protein